VTAMPGLRVLGPSETLDAETKSCGSGRPTLKPWVMTPDPIAWGKWDCKIQEP
jgi:hypothetical protein